MSAVKLAVPTVPPQLTSHKQRHVQLRWLCSFYSENEVSIPKQLATTYMANFFVVIMRKAYPASMC